MGCNHVLYKVTFLANVTTSWGIFIETVTYVVNVTCHLSHYYHLRSGTGRSCELICLLFKCLYMYFCFLGQNTYINACIQIDGVDILGDDLENERLICFH